MDETRVSWGRILGCVAGATVAGGVGAMVGGMTGSLIPQIVPEIKNWLNTEHGKKVYEQLGGVLIDAFMSGGEKLIEQWPTEDKLLINHDLQTAFRDALIEAIYDVGGRSCFPDKWQTSRDVPSTVVIAISSIRKSQPELADQLCDCLQTMVKAVETQVLLPLTPLPDHPFATAELYLQAETPEELYNLFFSNVISVYLQNAGFTSLLEELQALNIDLTSHLRRHLLDRVLFHLGELLKNRTPAWRAFNRLMLETLRNQIQHFGSEQREIIARLDTLIKQPNEWSINLADLLAATGRIEKRVDEQMDFVLTRVVLQHEEVLRNFWQLRETTSRIEFKVDRALRVLEGGKFEILGTPPVPLTLPPDPGEPPFLGLRYFDEQDASRFFGRETLTAKLLVHLGINNDTDRV